MKKDIFVLSILKEKVKKFIRKNPKHSEYWLNK